MTPGGFCRVFFRGLRAVLRDVITPPFRRRFHSGTSPRSIALLSVQLCLQQQRITQRGSCSTYSFILLWRV